MNIAVIFAGGTGQRMHTKEKPKQFLMIHGKPIIVHTIELFEQHPEIDGIVVACLPEWIDYMKEIAFRYRLEKIGKIVPGGATGQLSIYNGLSAAAGLYGRESNIALIHDGVRPLIDHQTITDNIDAVKKYGSAITCTPATETVILINADGTLVNVPSREHSRLAKAPQSFWLDEILSLQEQALSDGYNNVIDSCSLMSMYGRPLHIVNGSPKNIKITSPEDFYMFRALFDAIENQAISPVPL